MSVAATDIAAVVVLYRPGADTAPKTSAVAAQVDHLFAIDNSEDPDTDLVETIRTLPNVTYVPLGDNLGIAAAFNAGIGLARESGYSWVLTMDQDSTPVPGMVSTLARCAGEYAADHPIGIVSPLHVREGGPKPKGSTRCSPSLTVMSSGNLLSVAAWEAVGGFDEGLFIDQVDNEICLHLHREGFEVLRCREARLLHRLGMTVKHTFPVTSYVTHHPAIRRYYITRNRLEVGRRYVDDFPEYRRRELHAMRREIGKIVLYEDEKWAKLLMSWRGYVDYRRGVKGRYSR